MLYENHVRVDFKQVLEKCVDSSVSLRARNRGANHRTELVNRVDELIRDERKRLERQRIEEEREAALANGTAPAATAAASASTTGTGEGNGEDKGEGEGSSGESSGEAGENAEVKKNAAKAVPTGPPPEIDRGLCVVCQDEEATLAVVDCG